MPSVKLVWNPAAKASFEELKARAFKAGKSDHFAQAHNEIVLTLRDTKAAFTVGEPLFQTQKKGGEVRLYVHKMIAVCYAIYRNENAGLILH